MKNILRDFQFALRGLRKSPVFTTIAILSLALGIGANTAIFSLVYQLILRPLAVRDPQSIVLLTGVGKYYGSTNNRNSNSYPMYQDFRDRNTVFTGMMCRYQTSASIGASSPSGTQVEVANTELVSGNYFSFLGIGAAQGRVFTANDDLRAGEHPYAVLSYASWKSRFAGDPGVIGKKIQFNNYPLTIIGVAQPGFDGMEPGVPAAMFVPVTMAQYVRPGFTRLYDRRQRWVNIFGRLKSGTTMVQAKAGLQPLFHQIIGMEVLEPGFSKASPESKQQFLQMSMNLIPGSQGNTDLRRQYDTALLVLMCVVALVLLIACANLASLLTARGAARQKEVAVRLALGSSRGRLLQQLLTESLVLSIAGAALGVALSVLLVKGLLSFMPANTGGYTISSTPDGFVLAFTSGLALIAALVFGLVPAVQSTRPDIAPVLKDQAGSVTSGTQILFRKMLVAGQITISLILLIGAGLFIRSLASLQLVDSGFRSAGLIQFALDPGGAGYKGERLSAYFQRIDDRLHGLPGVRATGMADIPVLAGDDWSSSITVEGYHAGTAGVQSYFNAITPGYLDTLGMHVLHGRDFSTRDTPTSPKVVLVNAAFAKKYFGDGLAVGRHIGRGSDPGTPVDVEIIGVVNDARYENLRDEISPQVFLSELQEEGIGSGARELYVKTDRDAASTFSAIRTAVRDIDPNVPVRDLETFDRQVSESLVTERLIATLSAVFGFLATALVLIGLYGTMTFMVTRRSREIGIRMALGAQAGNVVWLVMREVVTLIGAGVVIGLPVAWALSRLVQSQLYDTKPGDPLSIGLATLLLAAVSAAAGYIPARRASAYDPLTILRYE